MEDGGEGRWGSSGWKGRGLASSPLRVGNGLEGWASRAGEQLGVSEQEVFRKGGRHGE